jgi:phosphoglycerate dehydrogenase-like enzyme
MRHQKILVYHDRDLKKYEQLLAEHFSGVRLFCCRDRNTVAICGPQAEIAFVPYDFPQDLFSAMPHLKWVQIMAAGVEHFARNADRFKDIVVTRMLGVDAKYMAEYVLAYLLYFCQRIGQIRDAQREKKWAPFIPDYLHRRTCGIMGLGAVGSIVARKINAMGMRLVSWDLEQKIAPFVDRQYLQNELNGFLAESDFVIVVLPATPRNSNLIGRDVLKSMKKSAYLINISRGELVDDDALLAALKQGDIAGAVIDVARQEPLPADSPLWECPNLIITPHISGIGLPEDMVAFFKENFERYLKKEPLLGVVNLKRGF